MEHPLLEQMGEQEAANTETGLSLELISYGGIKNATKTELKESAEFVIEQANMGNVDALDILIICNKLEKFTEAVKDGVKSLALDQTKIADGEIYKRLNVSVEKATFGVRWNFKNTNDPIWNNIEAQRLEREAYLKTLVLPNNIMSDEQRAIYEQALTIEEVVDEDTGEVIQERTKINPPIKTGSTGLKITIER